MYQNYYGTHKCEIKMFSCRLFKMATCWLLPWQSWSSLHEVVACNDFSAILKELCCWSTVGLLFGLSSQMLFTFDDRLGRGDSWSSFPGVVSLRQCCQAWRFFVPASGDSFLPFATFQTGWPFKVIVRLCYSWISWFLAIFCLLHHSIYISIIALMSKVCLFTT